MPSMVLVQKHNMSNWGALLLRCSFIVRNIYRICLALIDMFWMYGVSFTCILKFHWSIKIVEKLLLRLLNRRWKEIVLCLPLLKWVCIPGVVLKQKHNEACGALFVRYYHKLFWLDSLQGSFLEMIWPKLVLWKVWQHMSSLQWGNQDEIATKKVIIFIMWEKRASIN